MIFKSKQFSEEIKLFAITAGPELSLNKRIKSRFVQGHCYHMKRVYFKILKIPIKINAY